MPPPRLSRGMNKNVLGVVAGGGCEGGDGGGEDCGGWEVTEGRENRSMSREVIFARVGVGFEKSLPPAPIRRRRQTSSARL